MTAILSTALAFQVNAQEVKLLLRMKLPKQPLLMHLPQKKVDEPELLGRWMTSFIMTLISRQVLPLSITFNTNSADLTYSAKQALDKVGRALNMDKLAEFSFVIEGHADLSGSYQLNQRLSKARAETVMHYLISMHDVEPNRLTAIGKGYTELLNKQNPLAEENRRVTLIRVDSQ